VLHCVLLINEEICPSKEINNFLMVLVKRWKDVLQLFGHDSTDSTFNTVLRTPAISSNIVMVSASAYLKVVYLTLTACVQDTKQAASTRQSYMELCLLYRVGRITAQALQTADASADVERRGEILRLVPESVCKLVIWPSGEF
jgi:hypothetical protein